MYPTLPNGKMVTLISRQVSGVDEYGNDVYLETTSQVGPCSVQPGASRETQDFNDQTVTGIIVFMPYGTVVRQIDAMIVDGVQYEISGKDEEWVSPFSGRTAPIRVYGIEVEGAST